MEIQYDPEEKLMAKRIFITGCAGSGTTLLNRLFLAFRNVSVIQPEASLRSLVNTTSPYGTIVRKRLSKHIFSNTSDVILAPPLEEQIELIKKNKIKIVNMIRDGRDIVYGYGPNICERWIESIQQAREYSDIITLTIKYEDLVKNPNLIQKKIAKRLGLKSRYKFSEYPKFYKSEYKNKIWVHRPRPITTGRIGKKHSIYKNKCEKVIEEFNKQLKYLGYIKK